MPSMRRQIRHRGADRPWGRFDPVGYPLSSPVQVSHPAGNGDARARRGTPALRRQPGQPYASRIVAYHYRMRWVAATLFAVVGSWMAFDGMRALVVGDYVTPRSGRYSGELGPWSRLVESVGIPARSTGMKLAFVTIGLLHLVAAGSLFNTGAATHWIVLAAAVLGVWYLPIGTIADGIILAVVLFTSLRPWR